MSDMARRTVVDVWWEGDSLTIFRKQIIPLFGEMLRLGHPSTTHSRPSPEDQQTIHIHGTSEPSLFQSQQQTLVQRIADSLRIALLPTAMVQYIQRPPGMRLDDVLPCIGPFGYGRAAEVTPQLPAARPDFGLL